MMCTHWTAVVDDIERVDMQFLPLCPFSGVCVMDVSYAQYRLQMAWSITESFAYDFAVLCGLYMRIIRQLNSLRRSWKSESVESAESYLDTFRDMRVPMGLIDRLGHALQYAFIILGVVNRRITVPRWTLIMSECMHTYETCGISTQYMPIGCRMHWHELDPF
jgi:hypothetical protein